MKRMITLLTTVFMFLVFATSGLGAVSGEVISDSYKAGDAVTIKGSIEPGQDLYLAVSQKDKFSFQETDGAHETKIFKTVSQEKGFTAETEIPPLYYLLTTNPDAYGEKGKKKYGGPSVLLPKGQGLYSTTMFYLKDSFGDLSAEARAMLGPIKSEEQWNFFRFANESKFGINTVVKEGTKVGKVVIFSKSILTDEDSGNYWDKNTHIDLDKETGDFTATFQSYRHTPPDTEFDVYVNGAQTDTYLVEGNGFWLDKGFRYMNPLWIIIGAIIVGTYFSMIGAAGGMLMAAFQVLVVHTAGPVGINAANVLKPSNMALTLFSPLGSFYRYAVKEKRVAWPVGLSFGIGIFIGSIWLGKYVSQYLPLRAYKEWLAVLVVLMGIRTLFELTPKAMEKRKNIKAMTKKFNDEVAKAKAEGRAAEMGKIEPVKSGITDYRFKFWGEEFTINP
ncbi:MAG: sulfite exporter TauE/SafE family protein, partial [Desulfohalobiaceae bacterium]|nr:sulfite exporter TauE/SafE family protein [Desulfohalobiaceae bacterium]